MAEIDDLKRELADEKKKVALLERQNALYTDDATIRGYYVQNKIANQQINILDEFKFSDEIKKTTKDDKYYDRAKALWEGMPDMIAGLNRLKIELKITGNQNNDMKKVPLAERLAETRQ
tara:strand:+ start:142 stop:498 length:357 start_codon:yes stop_codon:yes gene_type:complete